MYVDSISLCIVEFSRLVSEIDIKPKPVREHIK